MEADINLSHQAAIAGATVFALDWLKRARWFPWLNDNTEKVNKLVSLAVAVVSATGLQIISVQGGLHAGGQFTVVYPALDTMVHAAVQFYGQELLHKALGNHQLNKQIVSQISALTEMVKGLQAGGRV